MMKQIISKQNTQIMYLKIIIIIIIIIILIPK